MSEGVFDVYFITPPRGLVWAGNADLKFIEWTPSEAVEIEWSTGLFSSSASTYSLVLVPIDRGYGRGQNLTILDNASFSNDSSSLIYQTGYVIQDNGYQSDYPKLAHKWTPERPVEGEGLYRLHLFVNQSATSASSSAGVYIDTETHAMEARSSNPNMHVQKLGAESIAGLAIISMSLLATALISLLFMSWNMFTTQGQTARSKKRYRTQDGSIRMATLTGPKYRQVAPQDTAGNETMLGEDNTIRRDASLKEASNSRSSIGED